MIPRILISATRKSSGKTTVALGLGAAWTAQGLAVRPFKKGPDFIDPAWLTRAVGATCHNLDFFMMGRSLILENFTRHAAGGDVALIEGNHGYYDGQDLEGSDCGAALAELLRVPVLLVVDCKGASRGIAALVKGHLDFPGGSWIRGLVLNNIGSPRHEQRLRAALERFCPVPILGAIPRNRAMEIDERHLGLQPVAEGEAPQERLRVIREIIAAHVDLEAILALARSAPAWPESPTPPVARPFRRPARNASSEPVRVAMALDEATHFYYPENLEALREAGVELVPFSMLNASELPSGVEGLYLGGGFPEVFMEALAGNRSLLAQIRRCAEADLPIFAECGGLMMLAERITWGERHAAMIGALPIEVSVEKKPVGYGYMRIEGGEGLSWPGAGVEVACHEFHHSRVTRVGEGVEFAFRVLRGYGVDGRHDGLIYRRILACYAHVHAEGSPGWAEFLADFWRAKKRK
ncbi:MAG: cobyrinate a,c-diamide synthase [Magnetococcales bacterium]|nr:cobyrinate a,c-diamide synthase [Magnetococcales bacterium]